jgi:small subunit ribosomal protein S8
MPVTDPIADMLTCIRNALQAGHNRVDVPASRTKRAIADLLVQEKFVRSVKSIEDEKQGVLRIYLKYSEESKPSIQGIKRMSTPGRRVYVGQDEVPLVLRGMGTAVVSTSEGILTGREAQKRGIGGELLATVW